VTRADVVIVGAGLIGLCAAYEFRKRGLRVTVLESDAVGRGASWAGGGVLWPIYPWKYPRAVQRLAMAGAAGYPALTRTLAQATGIDPECRVTGALLLDLDERDAAHGWCAQWSMHALDVDDEALARVEPRVTRRGRAVRIPDVTQVRNPRLIAALAAYLHAAGVRIQTGQTVLGVERAGGRFEGLRTETDVSRAEIGVLATGAWTHSLAPQLPRVFPVRGQMLLFRAAPDTLRHIVLEQGRYLIPRADGRILAGSTIESEGFDCATTSEARESLRQAALGMMPSLADCPIERQWAGLRPATDDGLPLIGGVPDCPGLWVSAGHYRNGVAAAPSSAVLLADMVEGTGDRDDAAAFSPERDTVATSSRR